jgi:hypothetical protein
MGTQVPKQLQDYIINSIIAPMNSYGYIYLTIFPKGDFYIGQHKSRLWDSKYFGSGTFLFCWLKKYNFTKRTAYKSGLKCYLLAWAFSKWELNNLEFKFINLIQNEPLCRNYRSGGNQPGFLEDSIQKMRTSLTGRRLSTKQKISISLGHIGQKPWNKDKTQSAESNEKRSNTLKKQPVKKILCLETDEILTLREIKEKYNLNHSHIIACCNHTRKSCGKKHWIWAEGYNGKRKQRKVECIELNKILTLKEAKELTNLKTEKHIADVCNEIREISGGYHWKWAI